MEWYAREAKREECPASETRGPECHEVRRKHTGKRHIYGGSAIESIRLTQHPLLGGGIGNGFHQISGQGC